MMAGRVAKKRDAAAATSGGARGHLAIRSARIENFRGFADVALGDIRRVNIIVGENGAGKTALLEALFLAATKSPDRVLDMRRWRGLPAEVKAGDGDAWEYLSRDLFRDCDTSRPARVSITGDGGHSRCARVFRGGKQSASGDEAIPNPSSICFAWQEGDAPETIVTPGTDKKGRLLAPAAPPSQMKGAFLSLGWNADATIERFAELRKAEGKEQLLGRMREQFDGIEDVSVESEQGHRALLVKRRGVKTRLPLNLLSAGMRKIFDVLLYFVARPRDFLLVDELDNGVYFGRHELFWKQIVESCMSYETQLFATAHSREFLEAALPAMRAHSQEFSLVRVYQEGGVGQAAIVSGAGAVTLLESGLEVRL